MSILKFRAWHKKNKQMRFFDFPNFASNVFGFWTYVPPAYKFSCSAEHCDPWIINDIIVMQSFFGFKDINGIELFEQDIVRLKDGSDVILPFMDSNFFLGLEILNINFQNICECTLLGNKLEELIVIKSGGLK